MLRHLSSTLTYALQTVRPLVLVGGGILVGILTAGLFNVLPSLQAQSASPLTIQPDTGRVGIGTTTPAAKLHVSGTTGTGIISDMGGGETLLALRAAGTTKWSMNLAGTGTGDLRFVDTADRVTFQLGGNVGIGTTTPAKKLTVFGTAPAIRLDHSGTASGAFDLQVSDNSSSPVFNLVNPAGFAGIPLVSVVRSSGNVGVGTTAPTEKLDVNGAIKIGDTASPCDAAHRGTLRFFRGVGGTDELHVCMQAVDRYAPPGGSYLWTLVASSPVINP